MIEYTCVRINQATGHPSGLDWTFTDKVEDWGKRFGLLHTSTRLRKAGHVVLCGAHKIKYVYDHSIRDNYIVGYEVLPILKLERKWESLIKN